MVTPVSAIVERSSVKTERLYPDALFVFLWRDPRENVSSIMEAWRSGHWVTYPQLAGWDGSWSMLLPPGWPRLRGRPLEEIAAFQWQRANEIVLDDLMARPRERWTTVGYADLLCDPVAAVCRICDFAGLEFDAALQARTAGALPASRHTLTAPDPGKWRRNEAEVLRGCPRSRAPGGGWSRSARSRPEAIAEALDERRVALGDEVAQLVRIVARVGGVSGRVAPRGLEHVAPQVLTLLPVEYSSLPVLGFVRNPWSYYVSWHAFQAARPQPNPLFRVLSDGGRLDFAATIDRMLELGRDERLLESVVAALPDRYTNRGLNLPGFALAPIRGSGLGFDARVHLVADTTGSGGPAGAAARRARHRFQSP